jgi:hypothetical protein
MSYPGVDPGDVQTMNPVGTQENSSGEPQKFQYKEVTKEDGSKVLVPQDPPVPVPNALLKEQVQQTVSDMFAPTDAWSPRGPVKFKHEFPSGQVALVKHLGTMDLIEYDLLDELDFFTRRLFGAVTETDEKTGETKSETLSDSLRDPAKRVRFLNLTGQLMAAALVKPKIVHDGCAVIEVEGKEKVKSGYQMSEEDQIKYLGGPIPKLGKGEVYSGPIDFADRMSLFHELNKPLKQIEPFREESATVVQDMAASEGNGDKTE